MIWVNYLNSDLSSDSFLKQDTGMWSCDDSITLYESRQLFSVQTGNSGAIDNSYNDRVFLISSKISHLMITFASCQHMNGVEHQGRGFRAIVEKQGEYITVYNAYDLTTQNYFNCHLTFQNVMSYKTAVFIHKVCKIAYSWYCLICISIITLFIFYLYFADIPECFSLGNINETIDEHTEFCDMPHMSFSPMSYYNLFFRGLTEKWTMYQKTRSFRIEILHFDIKCFSGEYILK